jgi:TonB family protein
MKTSGWNVPLAVALALAMTVGCLRAGAQSSAPSEAKRQAKRLMTPQYPELARKLNLSGSVRVAVTIAPDGSVKHTRILGGHPLLAASAEEAAQKSTFEPGPKETIETIEFKF